MTEAPEIGPTVLIRLAADPERLAGRLQVNDGPERHFSGWLELLRELEQARATGEKDGR